MRQDVDSLKVSHSGGMSFSAALEYLKKGYKIQRSGWNGKGMYLQLKQSYPVDKYLNASALDALKSKDDMVTGQMLDHIVMKTAGESKYWGEGYSDFVPWLASQTDILARDWHVLEEVKKEPELLHQIRLDINLRHFYNTFEEFKHYFNQVHNSNFAFENIKYKMYPLIYGVEKKTGTILKHLGLTDRFEAIIDFKDGNKYYINFYATDVFSIVYQIAKDFKNLNMMLEGEYSILLERVDLYDDGGCELLFHTL